MGKRIEVWDGTPVPPKRWGKDHFSTLLYIETRCVDGNGTPNAAQMRTASGRPRRGNANHVPSIGGKDYPTILRGGDEIRGHDDWDCASDLEVAGVIVWNGTGLNPVFSLTAKGWELVGRLRRHLAERPNGKRTYQGFEIESVPGFQEDVPDDVGERVEMKITSAVLVGRMLTTTSEGEPVSEYIPDTVWDRLLRTPFVLQENGVTVASLRYRGGGEGVVKMTDRIKTG